MLSIQVSYISQIEKAVFVMVLAVFGLFMSLDLFFIFIWYDVSLFPMYLLIGIWGGPRRIYASVKFFLYTALGSALMLAGIIALAFFHREQSGVLSFSYQELLNLELTDTAQLWLFGAFGLGDLGFTGRLLRSAATSQDGQ